MFSLRYRLHERSLVLRGWLLDGLLVGRQRLVPKPVELGAKRRESRRVDSVNALFACACVDHEPCVSEDFEVLRDRWPADREDAGQVADRAGTLDEQLEDRAPGGIAEGG